jgi:hypothetical protein
MEHVQVTSYQAFFVQAPEVHSASPSSCPQAGVCVETEGWQEDAYHLWPGARKFPSLWISFHILDFGGHTGDEVYPGQFSPPHTHCFF